MPRSGWLAIGVVLGAIAVGSLAAGNPGVGEPIGPSNRVLALALAMGAIAVGSWLVVRQAGARRRVGLVGRAGGLLALGFLVIALRTLAQPPAPLSTFAGPLPDGAGPWIGVVDSVAAPRGAERRVVLALEEPAGLRVAATLPVFPPVVPGDRILVSGSLEIPPEGEYGTYLTRIGVRATVRGRSLHVEPASSEIGRRLEGLRRGADEALRLAIPEPEAGLASGVLVGLRDRVDRDLTAAFTAVGATHVVAISGWNIAIVATTVAALGGRFARRRRAALTAVAIIVYTIFVGPSASVVRAAAMAGVVLLARELGRPSTAAAAIGWAVTGLLLADPGMVGDAGFQLSTLATAGLIAWGTPLSARLAGPDPGRPRAWLAESLGVSLAAQAVTLPVVLAAFGRLSLVSPIVNLGVVPLVAPAMAAGMVALLAGLAGLAGIPLVATLLGLPAWALFGAIVGLVRVGAAVPFASVVLEPPWDLAGAGLAVAGLAAVAFLRARRTTTETTKSDLEKPHPRPTGRAPALPGWVHGRPARLLSSGLAAAVFATGVAVVHRPDGIPRVIVLDVGQGDAILVESSRGGRLLVDGGPDPGRLLIALDERLPPWDRRIDLVVLTHPHEDHAAGLASLLERYAVGRVLEPGMIGPGPGYAALEAVLSARDVPHGILVTGNHLALDEIVFRVLWPDPGSVPERPADGGTAINNVSIVLLGEVGRHRFLLAGDIEEGIDPTLIARGLPAVDMLKVAHHGSRTSSTAAFLAAVHPGVAVASAGAGNPYGHPAPATMVRLAATGAIVRRTDRDGTVEVELGPGPVRVRATGGRRIADLRTASASGLSGSTRLAFLCGIATGRSLPTPAVGLPGPPTTAGTVVAGRPMIAFARGFAPLRAAPPAPTRPLGYDAVRDRPDPTRSRRVLLGRRQLRPRCGRGVVPLGPGALSRRSSGALAGSRRWRSGPDPRGGREPPRDGHDVRCRDARHPVQRRAARPPQC